MKKQLDSKCDVFITLYSEMLKHDTHEAEYYLKLLKTVQNREIFNTTLKDELNFWNHIMEEHAMFIYGLLDPTEKNLKQAANLVAKSFEKLLNQSINLTQNLLIKESIESTNKIISYKEAATSGLLKCQIKSIIPPLLADHVLREANYYLRILNIFCK